MAFTFHSATLNHLFLLLIIIVSTTMQANAGNTTRELYFRICNTGISKNVPLFVINVAIAVKPIAENITKYGFGVGIGGDTDLAYALSQCFGYLSKIDCQQFYGTEGSFTSQSVSNNGGRMYLDGCFFRVADYNFIDAAVDSSDTYRCSNTSAGTSNST